MAIAPESVGIGLRRRYTTAGQHPYDTVVWERRDARISHWATGAVAFEQAGVEVPSTWSVNATNILAQKYFRGTMGTPERESSLKQVADRVVDTITAWGVKDGYFVDDSEAEIFSDELKYLIIHQKAAFNSPVWFNIGVKGVPQQGSACQPYDALVVTPDGLQPIGRLVECAAIGTKVYDANGLTRIVAAKANGRKPVLRIHTKAGVTLDVTGDHLVWRASGDRTGSFVPASDLVAGDQLSWHRTESWGIGEITTTALAEAALAGCARGADMTVPPQLFDAPLPVVRAYLRSIFQADGYVSPRLGGGSKVGLDMISEGIVRGAQALLARFGIFSRVRFKADARLNRQGCWCLSIGNAGDRQRFADEIGFIDETEATKLEASLDTPGRGHNDEKRLEIERVEARGEMDVFDIQTESGEYLSGNLRVHNCFILAVEDSMDSILNWYKEEGVIFKGGSGAGVNLSRIRSSYEGLRGGGTASGPVSFMRGADASAGTIKSGGKTRRAAKMVILDVDHPDIEDFIWCKTIEERKARALRDAGFDMDLDGKDSHSIQYQNANNSVRVTDEFMQAVVDDADWGLKAVTDGEVVRTIRARDLFRQIAKAAWECADPGMQFDTTINRWHTAPNHGRINGSNPCFTGDALVHTDKGLVAFRELFDRANQGETFGVWTHDATNPDSPEERMELTRPEAFMITGYNDVVRLRFTNGMELRCTPGHRIFTTNRGYVEAKDLTPADEVKTLDLPALAVSADLTLPVATDVAAHRQVGDRSAPTRLPEKWTAELAHYLGWVVGDGCGADNGTAQLGLSGPSLSDLFQALGLSSARAHDKQIPWSVYQAPSEIVAAFLQGLFDSDGCVHSDDLDGSHVGLGSSSRQLLVGAQRLLSTLGIASRIYEGSLAEESGVSHKSADGKTVDYQARSMFDLRISAASISQFASMVGFSVPQKVTALSGLISAGVSGLCQTATTTHLAERIEDGYELTYNLSEPRNHSYVVNGLVVRNCSEYMHVDNSACNLASLNLLTYLEPEGSFDIDGFRSSTEVVFTAQEILVGNASYPTEKIAENSRRFRQLGIGYANLGALLMAQGLPYDSEEGRAWAGAITALLTGHAYATSARTAARMGPFSGFTQDRDAMLGVLRMHRDAAASINEELVPPELLSAAQEAWDQAVEVAEQYGVRNAQASVLAPTGCLVGGSLVATDRGLVRLASLGDPEGAQWQDLDAQVATDDGPRRATKFYVNGLEPIVTATTVRGHRIQGTPQHRIKVVDAVTGEWRWVRFADLRPEDIVPMSLDQLVGDPVEVVLPPLAEAYWTGEHNALVPRTMTADLAELVGYFMGDGSLHSRGLRFCVTAVDVDVVGRLRDLAKELFALEAVISDKGGYTEVRIDSVRLVLWWEACGFAKRTPSATHHGKGYEAQVPDAVLGANDPRVYQAFIRGLFEADGDASGGYANLKNTSSQLARDVQSLLLALGYPTSLTTVMPGAGRWGSAPLFHLRLLNLSHTARWGREIGFMSERKRAAVAAVTTAQSGRHDHIPLTREIIDRLAPANDRLRRVLLAESARGTVTRTVAGELLDATGDPELSRLLSFFYDRISTAELGEEEFTYDISVPSNVTYTANGFVSHNTIGLLMDCDTTGVEPDLGLVKMKKLVGGGTMSIVNQTVPRALRRLGYGDAQIAEIIGYIDEHKSILGAPHLTAEHLPVFACSMGDNTIHYQGHIHMMAAVQPFISGAISKTVNVPESVTVEEVEQLHIEAWQLGLKAIAMYRDNCKVAQPLATAKKALADPSLSGGERHDAELAVKVAELERALERQTTVVVKQPIRERMPRRRTSSTFAFRVADCEGFVTVGEYEDGRPGEVFMKVAKQGSTLAGIMDAFAISVSLGLQHGVPLATYVKKYTNMRFEPAGMTDDPDLRIASSLVDYIFRRLAVDYLPPSERAELGVMTSAERTQQTLPGIDETVTPNRSSADVTPLFETGEMPVPVAAAAAPTPPAVRPTESDAPYCGQCGVQMQRAGSCHACPSCGTTSGCS